MSAYLILLPVIFIILLAIREYSAFKKNLTLKYLLTPLVTFSAVIASLTALPTDKDYFYIILIASGLILALIGDALMMIEETDLFLHGLLFFLLTQIIYIAAFAAGYEFKAWNLIPAFVLVAFIPFFYITINKKTGKHNIPVLVYMMIMAVMLFYAFGRLNRFSAKSVFIFIGAMLFVFSDIMLAVNKFIKKIPNSTVYVWMVYAPAQFLIGFSCNFE